MPAETPNDQPETLGDDTWTKRLDHLDEMVHQVSQHLWELDETLKRLDAKATAVEAFIDEHRPALTRGLGMLDPGMKMRDFLKGRHHGKGDG